MSYLNKFVKKTKNALCLVIASLRSVFTLQYMTLWIYSSAERRNRIYFILFIFGFSFIIIMSTLIKFAASPEHLYKVSRKKSKFRREIVDRNGVMLAVNVPSVSLYAHPHKILDKNSVIEKLSSILQTPKSRLKESLIDSGKKFVWLKRSITPDEQFAILALGVPGLEFEKEYRRVYPFKEIGGHIVGYVNRDLNGLAGIELAYDHELSDVINYNGEESKARKVKTTIDIRVQNILGEELSKAVNKFDAAGGSAIVIDISSAEVLGMLTAPDFDPNELSKAKKENIFNMATSGVYELGSVLKALTIAIGLDTGVTSMSDAYDLSYMKVKDFRVKDYHTRKGWHSLGEIFLHSSNIGVGQIMLEIGKERFKEYIQKLGLTSPLQLEIKEKAYPIMYPFESWNELNLVTMSYGYGISISPMHFVQAMLPVVNGGIKRKLKLIKHPHKINEEVEERIFKPETSVIMRKLLRLAVSKGTAGKAEVPGYLIGAKTGTANKSVGGRYDRKSRYASLIAIFPAHDPKYMLYLLLDNPQGIQETFGFTAAGWNAAPTAANILKRIGHLYSIPKFNEEDPVIQELLHIEYAVKEKT